VAITLGGITLPSQIVWANQFQKDPIAQDIKRTLGGGLVVTEQTLTEGRPIILQATQDQGWFTKAQVVAVEELASIVTTSYTLVFGSETFTVIFNHSQPPAVSFSPLVWRANSADTDYFVGTIKLLTV